MRGAAIKPENRILPEQRIRSPDSGHGTERMCSSHYHLENRCCTVSLCQLVDPLSDWRRRKKTFGWRLCKMMEFDECPPLWGLKCQAEKDYSTTIHHDRTPDPMKSIVWKKNQLALLTGFFVLVSCDRGCSAQVMFLPKGIWDGKKGS